MKRVTNKKTEYNYIFLDSTTMLENVKMNKKMISKIDLCF